MLANTFSVVSIIVFLVACICLLVPGMRLKSVLMWALSLALLLTAYALDQPDPAPVITAEERTQMVQQNRQRMAADLWVTPDEVPGLLSLDRSTHTHPPEPGRTPEPEPGWHVTESQGFTIALGVGDDEIVNIAVSCQGSTPAVLMSFSDGRAFAHGRVQAIWSDGTVDQYTFQQAGPYLQGLVSNSVSRELYHKLQNLNSVTVTVAGSGRRFTDRIGLSGSSAAIGSLSCA